MRYPNVLGVRTRITAERMRVAVDSGGGITKHRLLHFRIRVGVVAQRPEIMLAVPAFPAADKRRNDNTVSLLYFLDFAADIYHLTHELVADHIALSHRGDVAVNEMQIRPAGGGHADAQDGVMGVNDLGIRYGFDAEVVNAIPAKCSHSLFSFSESIGRSGARSGIVSESRDFSCFHQTFKALERFVGERARHKVETFEHRFAQIPTRGIETEGQRHHCAPIAGPRTKANRPLVRPFCPDVRLPAQKLVRPVFHDLGLPFDLLPQWTFYRPVR